MSEVWIGLKLEAKGTVEREPMLASFMHATILKHSSFNSALSYYLAARLDSPILPALSIREVARDAFIENPDMLVAAEQDLMAISQRDPACIGPLSAFLYYKGWLALQSYRIAHWLWISGRHQLALFFQSRISQLFGVDIHPAAKIGSGVMFDHASGIVIGETAVVGNCVSIMHSVTLGGTGKEAGDRHPKVGDGVLIGAGAKVLGNITIGEGAQIASGSVVLKPVSAHTLVEGVPAKAVGKPCSDAPAEAMNQSLK